MDNLDNTNIQMSREFESDKETATYDFIVTRGTLNGIGYAIGSLFDGIFKPNTKTIYVNGPYYGYYIASIIILILIFLYSLYHI